MSRIFIIFDKSKPENQYPYDNAYEEFSWRRCKDVTCFDIYGSYSECKMLSKLDVRQVSTLCTDVCETGQPMANREIDGYDVWLGYNPDGTVQILEITKVVD